MISSALMWWTCFVQPCSCFPLQASPRHSQYLEELPSAENCEGNPLPDNLWSLFRRKCTEKKKSIISEKFYEWGCGGVFVTGSTRKSIRRRRAASGIQTRVKDGSDGGRDGKGGTSVHRLSWKSLLRKYKWCSRGNALTFSLLPACLPALSGDVQRSGWHSSSHCRLLRAHPPTPSSIHRSADATLMHGGRCARAKKKKSQVCQSQNVFFFFNLAVISCGCSRQAADLQLFFCSLRYSQPHPY